MLEKQVFVVGNKEFFDKKNALRLEEIDKASKVVREAKEHLKELKNACCHEELSDKFNTTYLDGAAIFSIDPENVCYEQLECKIHSCKVCGVSVTVLPCGDRHIGWHFD